MGYADGLLSTGERIVHREKQHWFVFVWGAQVGDPRDHHRPSSLLVLASGTLAATAVGDRTILGWVAAAAVHRRARACSVWTILRYLNQEYVLTNRRVIQVEGVAQQDAPTDSSLEKINDARADPVGLRADLRLRRPRHPDGVGDRHRASSGCSATRSSSRRRCSRPSTSTSATSRAAGVSPPSPPLAHRAGRAAAGRRAGRGDAVGDETVLGRHAAGRPAAAPR